MKIFKEIKARETQTAWKDIFKLFVDSSLNVEEKESYEGLNEKNKSIIAESENDFAELESMFNYGKKIRKTAKAKKQISQTEKSDRVAAKVERINEKGFEHDER